MNTIIPLPSESPLDILKRCGGYYDQTGTGGPLVGYAGKYKDAEGKERQYVGRVYANFAKAEEHGPVLECFAVLAEDELCGDQTPYALGTAWQNSVGVCGAPLGGLAFASAIAVVGKKQYIFPEKVVTAVKTENSREQSELRFDRHEPVKGRGYFLVEDVANNFSTTKKTVELLEEAGGIALGIICFLNRSLEVHDFYRVREGLIIPVIAIVRKPIMQWEQSDSEVADDIARGNIVWKPKNEWHKIAPFVN